MRWHAPRLGTHGRTALDFAVTSGLRTCMLAQSASDASAAVNARQAAADAGALVAIVAAMRAHEDDEVVHEEGRDAKSHAAGYPNGERELRLAAQATKEAAELLAAESERLIYGHAAGAFGNRSLFLWLSLNAPHVPLRRVAILRAESAVRLEHDDAVVIDNRLQPVGNGQQRAARRLVARPMQWAAAGPALPPRVHAVDHHAGFQAHGPYRHLRRLHGQQVPHGRDVRRRAGSG